MAGIVRAQKRWQRVLLVVGAVLLGCCVVLLFAGMRGPSVGFAGLMTQLATSVAFAMLGVSLAIFLAAMVGSAISSPEVHIAASAAKGPTILEVGAPAPPVSSRLRTAALKEWARELGALLLNVLIYGGCTLAIAVAIMLLAKGDTAGIVLVAVPVCAVGVAGIVLWRRYRRRHPARFKRLPYLALLLLLAFLVVLGLGFGSTGIAQAVGDMASGPSTETCTIIDYREHHPTGRYAGFKQDTVSLTFITKEGDELRVSVAEGDIQALAGVMVGGGPTSLAGSTTLCPVAVGREVLLTCYPATGVLVSVELV